MESTPGPRSLSARPAAIVGGLLILLGLFTLLDNFVPWVSGLMWAAALALAGVLVYGVFLSDRNNWWLQIPAYVLWAVAGLIVIATLNLLRGEWIASYVLYAIGLPFLVVYVRNTENWWALIPAYVMAAIGTMIGLIGLRVLNDLLIPAYIMFAIAAPFLFVYLRNPRNWWALIPGGIMSLIGFGFFMGSGVFQVVVPVVLIAGGLLLIARQFFGGGPVRPERPRTGPEADRPPE